MDENENFLNYILAIRNMHLLFMTLCDRNVTFEIYGLFIYTDRTKYGNVYICIQISNTILAGVCAIGDSQAPWDLQVHMHNSFRLVDLKAQLYENPQAKLEI